MVAHSVNRRYRYGSYFVDEESGVRFEGHHPAQRPDLWKKYLDGAEGRYRSRGVEEAFHREELEAGTGVSLFFLGFDPDGNVVGGMRVHGPLDNRFDAAIMGEMASSPEIGLIGDTIDKECRLGAIEIKGAWSNGEAAIGRRLLATFGRATIHALSWLGAEFAVLAVADRMIPTGILTGCIQIGTESVAFPDERYRTVALSYRRGQSYDLAHPDEQHHLRREAEQLARGPLEDAGAVPVDSAQYQAYRPLVLDVTTRAQREVLRTLREEESLQVLDRYDEQHTQLGSLIDVAPGEIANDGQRWVYYPWRRAVVRVLGPRSFEVLRLNRNRNKITKKEQKRLRALRVGVIGASAGHSIAHALALEGLCGELRLADFDHLELHNLNRIPTGVVDLGLNKAVSLARRIAEVDPYLRLEVFQEGVTSDNLSHFLDGLDLVIEECDSLDVKVMVREKARELRLPVIMETSDRGVLDVERFDLEPDRPIFHGLLGELDSTILAGLTTEQKNPIVLQILGAEDVSARAAASALELGSTVSGWPQLASEVTLGGATVATAVRRFGLGHDLPSGRVRIDLDEIVGALQPVRINTSLTAGLATPPPVDPPLQSDNDVELILDAARRAPSGGNVQPWKFSVEGDTIHFFADTSSSSVMDIQHRGTYLAIGAALFNARVMAASLRKLGSVHVFPDRQRPDLVATFTLGQGMDPEIEQLRDLLFTRSANRRMGIPGEVSDETLTLLQRSVEKEGVGVKLASSREDLLAHATMLGEADRWRYLLPNVHTDMMKELRIPGRDDLTAGLDVRTLELDPATLSMMSLLGRADVMDNLREWRGGRILEMRTKFSVATSSALAIVTVPRTEPLWYVRAGAAMERLWLVAERAGLCVQPVSPLYLYANDESDMIALAGERRADELIQHSESYRALWQLGPFDAMAMVLRLFYAPPPSVRSIRRPLHEVVVGSGTTSSSNGFHRTHHYG